MIRPTSPNHNPERDFWNNREPAESFINIIGEVRTHAIIATFVNPAKSLRLPGIIGNEGSLSVYVRRVEQKNRCSSRTVNG